MKKNSLTQKNSKENSDSGDSPWAPSTLSRYVGPTLILALVTAFFYFVGRGYYWAFFRRLSLSSIDLNFPITSYFMVAIPPCLMIFVLSIISFHGAKKRPTTFFQALRGNLVFIALFVFAIIFLLRIWENWFYTVVIVQGLICVVGFVLYSIRHRSTANLFYRHLWPYSWLWRIVWSIGGMLCLSLFAAFMGDTDATKLIEGTLASSSEITLELKSTNINLQSKSLILVYHHNGNYYVVEKSKPAPKRPRVYIIPDSQVKMATLRRIR